MQVNTKTVPQSGGMADPRSFYPQQSTNEMVDDLLNLEASTSQILVNPSQFPVRPSQNLVNPSGQQGQQVPTKIPLSEQGIQAKGDLEILVATGKTKDFLGKQLTFQDLDNLNEKELLKYHRIYQTALAVRVNDTFSKIAIKTYCGLVSWFLPLDDKENLYSDLRNDYILMNELDKWIGWLSLRMGGLMAVASTSLLTVGHCEIKGEQKLQEINGRSQDRRSQDGQSQD